MTDAGRKDMSSKIADKATPDTSKSTLDKVGENISGATDKLTRDAVPDGQKSTTQSAADKASRSKDSAEHDSAIDKLKGAVGLDKH